MLMKIGTPLRPKPHDTKCYICFLVCLIVFHSKQRCFAADTPPTTIDQEQTKTDGSLPKSTSGEPLTITVSMEIEGVSDLNAKTMDFRLNAYFRMQWVDVRLEHNGSTELLLKDTALLDTIWYPDLFFPRTRSGSYDKMASGDFLLWIHPNGSVLHTCRMSITVICLMDFHKWPLDAQRCRFEFMSCADECYNLTIALQQTTFLTHFTRIWTIFGGDFLEAESLCTGEAFGYDAYRRQQLLIEWAKHGAIRLKESISIPDISTISVTASYCDGNYSLGEWSCAAADFLLQRGITHYLLQYYFPTAVIVVSSWCSFWLDVDAVPARIALCITTLLTLTTQANAARLSLPEVSYVKAIDIWMVACMVFVFGALFEFTLANYAQRQEHKGEKKGTVLEKTKNSISNKFGLKNRYKTEDESSGSEEDDIVSCMLASQNNAFLLDRPALRKLGSVERHPPVDQFPTEQASVRNKNRQGTPEASESLLKERKSEKHVSTQMLLRKKILGRQAAQKYDEKSRWLFPCGYLVFNLCYWCYYAIIV